MIAPLKTMTVTPGNDFGVERQRSGLPDNKGKLRHIGVDLRASIRTEVYAPENGFINEAYIGSKNIKVLGLNSKKYSHRFLHLDKFVAKIGENVKAGQLIGYSGNTGDVSAHLHWDIRKLNSIWNASYYNYYDPMKLLKESDMFTGQFEGKKQTKSAEGWYKAAVHYRRRAKYYKAKLEGDSKLKALKDKIISYVKGV